MIASKEISRKCLGTFSTLGVNRDLKTDEELILAIRDGGEESLVELYRRYQAKLFGFAMQMTGSREVAEEAVQDAFLAVIHRPQTWCADRGTVRSFLYGLTRNVALRRYADHSEFGELDFDAPTTVDFLSDLEREERARLIREAIAVLPSGYREAVVLCDMEGLSYAEAADTMGCPIGTVRSRISRARAILAERLRARVLVRNA